MKNELKQLVELQTIDSEVQEFEEALARIPGQIDSARSDMEEKEKLWKEAKARLQALRDDRKQLELDTQAENDHVAKVKTKLPSVKTNKEYTAILTEVEAAKVKVAQFEDKELEIMETLEEKEKELPVFAQAYKEEEEKFNEYRAKKEAEAARVTQELESVKARRETIKASLEPRWVKNYEKIANFRDGQAVVRLKENICQGCHQHILPQMVIDIKVGEEIFQCQHCSRFLYWVEETEETAMPK
jgi:predicted  nucleic acid-binding Zn-ribbon protein